jgi:hypothetical protein
MPTYNGSGLINELSTRLRDPTNNGYPRATILNVLNRVQDCVNVRFGLVHNTATFTTGNTALYSTAAIASDYARPVQCFDGGNREIDLVPFESLVEQSPTWLRDTASRPSVYAPIGRELLAITPIPTTPMTMTLRYVKHLVALTDTSQLVEWPDEFKPLILDLTEMLLLLIPRDFRALHDILGRLAPKFGFEDRARTLRRGTFVDVLVTPKAK